MNALPRSIFAAAAAAIVLGPALWAHADEEISEPRLIRTEHETRWMSPEEIEALVEASHAAGHCGGFMDVTTHPLPPMRTAENWSLADRQPRQQEAVTAVLPKLSGKNIATTVKRLAAFHNRYYQSETGELSAEWIRDQFQALAKGRSDVTVELFNHDFRQPSVIARIQGSGSAAAEKVVLGAHEDSVNWDRTNNRSKARAPGADDNASGVAVLLEVFRGLMESDYHPVRTVEFMAYAGEELGLLGSQDIAYAYRHAAEKVVGVLQMDMTMYPGKKHKITFIRDNTNRSLTRFTQKLVETYVKTPWQESSCGYACSDHASWDDQGYPTVFPFESTFEEMNPNVHSADDTFQNGLDEDFGLQFAKLNTAFAIEMGTP